MDENNEVVSNNQEVIENKTIANKPNNITISYKALIIIGIIAVIVIIIYAKMGDKNIDNNKFSAINLRAVYDSVNCNSTYCTIGSDNSYLQIDTNPNNRDDYYSSSAGSMIKSANLKCGFSEYLYTRMGQTRALDGTQNEENDNFKVTWTYHPDQGLEVIYSVKNK